MKKYLFVLFLLPAFKSLGQPVIHHAIDYVAGDTFTTLLTSVPSNFVDPTGTNYTWDFSGLTTDTINAIEKSKAVAISATPHSSQFPLATISVKTQGHSGTTLLLTYSYYQSAGFCKFWGTDAATINGIDTNGGKVIYLSPERLKTSSPLTIGTAFADTSVAVNYYGGNDTSYEIRDIRADGYGKLMLPNGRIFDSVLRIKTTTAEYNTLNKKPVIKMRYTWYQDRYKTPLLQIDTFQYLAYGRYVPNYTISYLLDEVSTITAVNDIDNKRQQFQAYFNRNDLFISGPFTANKPYYIQLYNLLGQKLYSADLYAPNNSVQLSIPSSLSSGIYILNMMGANDKTTIKVYKN